MRCEPNLRIEAYRSAHPTLGGSRPGSNCGYFEIDRFAGLLRIISSGTDNDSGWEHVSISLYNRCPTWDEMNLVKELFWDDSETVIQFHPKKEQYVNVCPYALHLWKKIGVDYELPPKRLLA